jgi:NTP pyrophosphatase (non-canonical NTP hydrolase)
VAQNKNLVDLQKLVEEFVSERNWQKYHTAKNLSMQIAIESAELMEHFLWDDTQDSSKTFDANRAEICKEIADIIIGCLALCNRFDVDPAEIIINKVAEIKAKYPVDKFTESKAKYNT